MKTGIAAVSDIDSLVNLLGFLFDQEVEFTSDASLQREGLIRIIENPLHGEILVLRDNTQVLGMVNLLYTISTALGSRVAILEDMIIHPDFRNQGIGSILIQDAIQRAKKSGCQRITLLTDDDNNAAQRFYMRYGFKPSGMRAYRLILPGSDKDI